MYKQERSTLWPDLGFTVVLFVTPWTVACLAPLSMGLPRQEFWSGLPFPSPGALPDPVTEPLSFLCLLHWQLDSLPLSRQGQPSQSFNPRSITHKLCNLRQFFFLSLKLCFFNCLKLIVTVSTLLCFCEDEMKWCIASLAHGKWSVNVQSFCYEKDASIFPVEF